MSVAKFKVRSLPGRRGMFDGEDEATVEIDRGASTVTVRPKGRRNVTALPLSKVAEMVLWRIARKDAK